MPGEDQVLHLLAGLELPIRALRSQFAAAVTELCDALETIDTDGWYSVIEVTRPWSRHNPQITGEFARPAPRTPANLTC